MLELVLSSMGLLSNFLPKIDNVLYRNDGCDPTEQLKKRQWQQVCVQVNPMGVQVLFDGREVCKSWFTGPVQNRPNRRFYITDPWYDPANAQIKEVTYTQLGDTMNPVLRYWSGTDVCLILFCFL